MTFLTSAITAWIRSGSGGSGPRARAAPSLSPGDPLGGPLFPQILPVTIESEGAARARGPEPPDPERVQAVIAEVKKVMERRGKP